MIFRKATTDDLDEIMRVAGEARDFLHANGIDQWKFGYPQREIFQSDIAKGGCHVGVENGRVEAVATLLIEPDPNYKNIEEGHWLTPDDARYGVIHRMGLGTAVRGKGMSKEFGKYLLERCREQGVVSLRADTHEQNSLMLGALKTHGFTYCGKVYIEYRPDYKAHWRAFEMLL